MALRGLGHAPGSVGEADWHNHLERAFSAVAGKQCRVCGLGGVGHAPDTKRLGYEPHPFNSVPVHCGHPFAGKQCHAGGCVHVGGHCEACN
jgi:hypothetical protein